MDRKFVQRYRCITCKKSFINHERQEKCNKEKLYSTRKEIAELYCMGTSLRDLSKKLKISRTTTMRKLDLISSELEEKFRDYETFNFNSHYEINKTMRPSIVFDEMETYEHTKLKPLSITIAYDAINKKIIDIQVSTFFPKGRFISELARKPHLREKYQLAKRNREDNRTETIKRVLENVKKYLGENNLKPIFITDGKASYRSLLKEVFQDRAFEHDVISSKEMMENFVKTSKYGVGHKKDNIYSKASFDALCASMRAKLSRLRRDSFIHTKKVANLQKTLFLFMDYWNISHKPPFAKYFEC